MCGFSVCPGIQTRPAPSEFRHNTASDICTGTIELKKGTKCFRRASEKYGTILHTETCLLEWVCAGSQNKHGKVAANRQTAWIHAREVIQNEDFYPLHPLVVGNNCTEDQESLARMQMLYTS